MKRKSEAYVFEYMIDNQMTEISLENLALHRLKKKNSKNPRAELVREMFTLSAFLKNEESIKKTYIQNGTSVSTILSIDFDTVSKEFVENVYDIASEFV